MAAKGRIADKVTVALFLTLLIFSEVLARVYSWFPRQRPAIQPRFALP
ncbi:hypothetical protein [Actibacterium mucosum]|nr:hypothetical protein [Actibacterium mucosum]